MTNLGNETTKKVAIYIRVSTLHQVDKDSLPMQRKDLIAYCTLILNTDNYTIFEDAGYSGKDINRPQYKKMMQQIRSGAFTHLLVWKIDRISRNLLDFSHMYTELKKLNVTFISKNEQFDTSTAIGEAMLKIILVFAELERNMTSERVTATMLSRANNGIWNGGRVPLGYDLGSEKNTFVINETEAKTIHLIFDKYEELKSITLVCYWLNEHGYRSKTGYEFSTHPVTLILNNQFYVGDYLYNRTNGHGSFYQRDENEWITYKDHHPAIITREQFARVHAILSENRKISPHKSKTKYYHIFHGIIYCDKCQKLMIPSIAHRQSLTYSNYKCRLSAMRKISCKSVSDPVIGEFVFNYILNFLNLRKTFKPSMKLSDIEKKLLKGDIFRHIEHIKEADLESIYDSLLAANSSDLYGKRKLNMKKNAQFSELKKIQAEIDLNERALERLTSLFLYSDEAISEVEYIKQKNEISSKLVDLTDKMGLINTEAIKTVSDEEFMTKASEFTLTQKLADKKHINYVNLANSVEASVLQSFVRSVIDNIVYSDKVIKSITFTNGLTQNFIYYENDPE